MVSPEFPRENAGGHTFGRQKWRQLAVLISSVVVSWAPWGYANLTLVENGRSRNDLAYSMVFPSLYLVLMIASVIIAWKAPRVFPSFQIRWFAQSTGRTILCGMALSFTVIAASLALRCLTDGLGLPRTPKVLAYSSCWGTAFSISYLARMVIVGPLVEEVFWRGYIQGGLQQVLGRPGALLVQALGFALVHLFSLADTALVFLIGLIYGVWRDRKKTLVPIIIAHIVFNSFGIIRFVEQRRESQQIQRISQERTTRFGKPGGNSGDIYEQAVVKTVAGFFRAIPVTCNSGDIILISRRTEEFRGQEFR